MACIWMFCSPIIIVMIVMACIWIFCSPRFLVHVSDGHVPAILRDKQLFRCFWHLWW